MVDWLYHHVEGFTDRRESRKYASNLLKAGYIRHTVNKITFSEQCYYIFGDLCGSTELGSALARVGEDGGGTGSCRSPGILWGRSYSCCHQAGPLVLWTLVERDKEYPSSLVMLLEL